MSTSLRTQILIADDHSIVRQVLQECIEDFSEFEVVGSTGSADAVLEIARERNPSLVLMDFTDVTAAIECTRALRSTPSGPRVIALTAHEDAKTILEWLRSGANCYVLKSSGLSCLREALEIATRGGVYLDHAAHTKVRPFFQNLPVERIRAEELLSKRELEIILYIAHGYTAPQISQLCNIGTRTIETYKLRACEKLQLKTKADLVRYAWSTGLLKERRSEPAGVL